MKADVNSGNFLIMETFLIFKIDFGGKNIYKLAMSAFVKCKSISSFLTFHD